MDILAHGLWAAAAAKACNLKNHFPNHDKGNAPSEVEGSQTHKLNAALAAFWGVFPDLFAFAIPFAWLIVGPLFGDQVPRLGPPEAGEPPPTDTHWVFHLASTLYNYSHSVIIFGAVIVVIWIFRKRIHGEMFGWLLHILIDIPTHSYEFYPTPFLWPLSQYKFNGISWATPWFFIATYIGLAVSYSALWLASRKKFMNEKRA